MKVFTCLSRNNSIVYENTKSNSLISKFNFKHKKRRSGPYFKRPSSPPGLKKGCASDKENIAPCGANFQTYREICSDTPPRQGKKNSKRGYPLPPIPTKASQHECDSEYLPLSHVCSPLREDNSQDTTIISVGVYDYLNPACDTTQSTMNSCDFKVSAVTITSSTAVTQVHDQAFVQSTGSLPHRTYSNVAVSTDSLRFRNTDSLVSDVCQSVDASSHYTSSHYTSQNTDTSSHYTSQNTDTSSHYISQNTDTTQCTVNTASSTQYDHDTSLDQYSLNTLAITESEDTGEYSHHDYYNLPQRFSHNVIESSESYDTLVEGETEIDVENISSSASEFLGCMSFGVQSLLEKDLDGWYYLLTEEVGRKKHLQAHTKPKPVLTARSKSTSWLSSLLQRLVTVIKLVTVISVEGLERIVITVQRGKNGFGFSFVDEFPPKVGRVDRASPAEQAGVKKGDMVIRINGQNVSRSTCEGVAHLVKKLNAHSITLELQREHVIKNTVEISASSNPHHPSPYNKRGVGTSTDHLYESITDRSDHHKENWVNGSQDEFLTDDDTAYYHHDQQKAITSTPRPFIKPTHRTVSTASLPTTNKHESIHRLMSLELDYIDFMHYGIERYSRPLRHCIVSAQQHMALFQNVEKLVTISEYHIKQMQDNTSSVDSDTEDSQSSESSMFPNSVALIYQSKVHMLCQAYESYANGLASSNTLLKELRKNRDFMSFVKDTPSEDGQSFGQPTISAFINRPVQHIQELCMVLSEIFAATPLHSPDFATLQQIVIKLSQCVTAITGLSSAGRVQSLDSLASSQGQASSKAASSSKGSMASLSSCSSAEADARCPLIPSSTASVRSLDRDVLRVQERLVLAPSVPAFQLCQESRHLIYQGNIYRCDRGSWFKSQLLLFSDLLLIVDEEPDGALLVTSSPTLIQDISGIEINRKYASEFVLHLQPATASTLPRRQPLTSSSGKAKAIVLRAPSAQEKFVWQSLLEQRVAAVNGSKLQHYGSMRDISNAKTSIIL
uniref:PDZ domain-containing protein n=1 Tax=Biomphalaria glabrata TaxID=6526 RepID=A0A2C9M8D8_BIOGL